MDDRRAGAHMHPCHHEGCAGSRLDQAVTVLVFTHPERNLIDVKPFRTKEGITDVNFHLLLCWTTSYFVHLWPCSQIGFLTSNYSLVVFRMHGSLDFGADSIAHFAILQCLLEIEI